MNTRGSSKRIDKANDDDVVLGYHGGGTYTNHRGNIQYRDFILQNKDTYRSLANRSNEKKVFPQQLMQQFHAQYHTARFLLYDKEKMVFTIAKTEYVENSINKLLHRDDDTKQKQNGAGRKKKYNSNNDSSNTPQSNNKKIKRKRNNKKKRRDNVSGVKSTIIPDWLFSLPTSSQVAVFSELDNLLAHETRLPWTIGRGVKAPFGVPVTFDSPLGCHDPLPNVYRAKYTIGAQYSPDVMPTNNPHTVMRPTYATGQGIQVNDIPPG